MIGIIPVERIVQKIYLIRGKKVMLDSDLAELYGVKTFNLNKAVKRNINRFPQDFMFQLSKVEYDSLRFQIGMLKRGKHKKYLPYVFTEQGVAMLSSVLRSERAVQINILIMRAFVKIRELLSTHKQLAEKVKKHEKKLLEHDKHLITIYELLNKLFEKPKETQKPKQIGFRPHN